MAVILAPREKKLKFFLGFLKFLTIEKKYI